MKNKNKLLSAVKENNFLIALNNYRRTMSEANKINLKWLDIVTSKRSKSDLEDLSNQFDKCCDSAYGSMVDALSDLTYLYEVDGLTRSGKYAVRGIFKFCMSKKDLRPIIKRACKKSKHSSLINLYKKYKKKIKVV